MKRLRFLPSVLMLVACIAVLCVGIYAASPTSNTVKGSITVTSMARVKITGYVDEVEIFSAKNTAVGVEWDLTESDALVFDADSATLEDQIPQKVIRIHIQNLSNTALGAYFYSGTGLVADTDGPELATYSSLVLEQGIWGVNLTEANRTDENMLASSTLSPYTYIAPANADDTYDEIDMFININVKGLSYEEVVGEFVYNLRLEEYQPNLSVSETATTSEGTNAGEINIKTAGSTGSDLQLIKLEAGSTTAVPTLKDATYGCIVIPTTYTSIPENALTECTGLVSIAIPQSITSVGTTALNGCIALKQIDWHAKAVDDITYSSNVFPAAATALYSTLNIASSVSALPAHMNYNCKALKNVHISNGVTNIGGRAFYCCTGLTSITIPDGVTSIGGDRAFYGCTGLTSITIPDGVTSIGSNAFCGCTGLTSVTIGNSVTSIGYGAFSGCTGLTSIIIPNSVTSIGNNAFSDCTGLTSVTIGNSVTSIDFQAFNGCTGLTSIIIPNSVTSIGEAAFEDCTGLTSIIVDSGNTKYNSRNNCNAIIETASNKLISGCKNTVIPSDVVSIGDDAFNGCTGLTSITIPNSVTSIGAYAFYKCTGLTSVTFENTEGWAAGRTALSSDDLSDTATAATYLKSTYEANIWKRS